MNDMILEIPLSNDILTTVRLTTGGICALAGLSFDDGEDCKVCVTESLLLLSHTGFGSARIAFMRGEGLTVCVEGGERTAKKHSAAEDEISSALICALAENVTMEKTDGTVKKIAFQFGRTA